MSPQLLITVDTELSNFPDGQGLWGRVGSGNWGLERMIAAFNTNALRATFFLDVYGKTDAELAHQKNAAKLIAESGHDLQLHTHPAPAFDRKRHQLRDYTLAEQREIIRQGADRIYDWTGTRPVLHRAGDWAADHQRYEIMGFAPTFLQAHGVKTVELTRKRSMVTAGLKLMACCVVSVHVTGIA